MRSKLERVTWNIMEGIQLVWVYYVNVLELELIHKPVWTDDVSERAWIRKPVLEPDNRNVSFCIRDKYIRNLVDNFLRFCYNIVVQSCSKIKQERQRRRDIEENDDCMSNKPII